ncbi:uncharacterized protein J3D65DRAFT_1175 [Phyllosticta citribraziliensis]|uniref:Uncharacterized protein n=1 Tax=Phyllosticta citribraziliensis TaxID=989973 RepID=A0ABR1M7Z0_9PEZI
MTCFPRVSVGWWNGTSALLVGRRCTAREGGGKNRAPRHAMPLRQHRLSHYPLSSLDFSPPLCACKRRISLTAVGREGRGGVVASSPHGWKTGEEKSWLPWGAGVGRGGRRADEIAHVIRRISISNTAIHRPSGRAWVGWVLPRKQVPYRLGFPFPFALRVAAAGGGGGA